MTKESIYNLKTNEDYRRLIPPMSLNELKQLEKSIIRDGCHKPLIVWNNTLIDGYNQYEICTRLQIPFIVEYKNFKSHEETISWICKNQLQRLDITDESRKYLIGKRYEAEKILRSKGISAYPSKKSEIKSTDLIYEKYSPFTSEWLAKEYIISHSSVEKYGVYSKNLDELSKVLPAFVLKILSGHIKISHECLTELSLLSPKELMSLKISAGARKTFKYSDIRKVIPKRQKSRKIPLPLTTSESVKVMPIYDPDAEISSLTLTIPSWVSSINRTRSVADFKKISYNARCNLMNELFVLKETIEAIYLTLKEDS